MPEIVPPTTGGKVGGGGAGPQGPIHSHRLGTGSMSNAPKNVRTQNRMVMAAVAAGTAVVGYYYWKSMKRNVASSPSMVDVSAKEPSSSASASGGSSSRDIRDVNMQTAGPAESQRKF